MARPPPHPREPLMVAEPGTSTTTTTLPAGFNPMRRNSKPMAALGGISAGGNEKSTFAGSRPFASNGDSIPSSPAPAPRRGSIHTVNLNDPDAAPFPPLPDGEAHGPRRLLNRRPSSGAVLVERRGSVSNRSSGRTSPAEERLPDDDPSSRNDDGGDDAGWAKRIDDLERRHAHEMASMLAQIDSLKAKLSDKESALGQAGSEIESLRSSQDKLSRQIAQSKERQAAVEKQIDETMKALALRDKTIKEMTRMRDNVLCTPAPTGQVTLVFTDVEASTEQWEMFPQVMSLAIRLHNRAMRELIDEFKGYEVKTEGDAFMVAFAKPANAVKFCLKAQEALLQLDWPEALYSNWHSSRVPSKEPGSATDGSRYVWRGLRVRMGVHVGEPECVIDPTHGRMDYFGPMVNKSARIGGAAHGGQVLISKAVLEAVESLLPTDRVRIAPLGVFTLKGIEAPEALYSVVALSLREREFPPPKCEGPNDSEQNHMEKRMKQLVDENVALNTHLKDLEDQLRRSRELAVGLLCRVRPQAKNEVPKGEQLRLDTALSQIERFLEDATKFKSELDNVSKQSTAMAKEIETLRVGSGPNLLTPGRAASPRPVSDLENQLSASNAEIDRLRAKVRDLSQSLKDAEASYKKAVESTRNSEKNKENIKDYVDKLQAEADKARADLEKAQKALDAQGRDKSRLSESVEQLTKDIESLKQAHEKERQYLTKKVDGVMGQMDAIRAFLGGKDTHRDASP